MEIGSQAVPLRTGVEHQDVLAHQDLQEAMCGRGRQIKLLAQFCRRDSDVAVARDTA